MKKYFIIIFVTVLAAMASIATFNPILGLLARNLGLSEVQSGSLVSVTGLFWIIGSFLWAKWARSKRKLVMLIAMIGYVLTLVAFAYTADFAAGGSSNLFVKLLLLRAVGGFFFGAIPAMAQSYLMEWTTAENRAAGMALFGGANGLGFVLGPAIGAALTSISFTAPMYASAFFIVVVIIIFALMIPSGTSAVSVKQKGKLTLLDPRIRLFIGIGLVLSTVMIILQVTCGIYIQDSLHFSSTKSAQAVGLGLSIGGMLVVLIQLIISRYFKGKPLFVLTVGLTALSAAFLLLLVAPSLFIVVFIFFGIGIGFTLPGYITAASLAVHQHEQPAVAAYTGAAQGMGTFIGPLSGTLLYSLQLTLPYLICFALLLLFLTLVLLRKSRQYANKVSQ